VKKKKKQGTNKTGRGPKLLVTKQTKAKTNKSVDKNAHEGVLFIKGSG